jgi:hypothetical protein
MARIGVPAYLPGMARIVKAVDIARREGVDPKTARGWLRAAGLSWHVHNAPWQAPEGSDAHHDMERVIARRGHA